MYTVFTIVHLQVALKELSDFLAEKLKMSAAEKASWGVVADDILKAMNDTF